MSKNIKIFCGELLATFIFVFFTVGSVCVTSYLDLSLSGIGLFIMSTGQGIGVFLDARSIPDTHFRRKILKTAQTTIFSKI